MDWAKGQSLAFWWGKGKNDGSFFPGVTVGNQWRSTFSVWTYGRVEIQFQHMKSPFKTAERRIELLDRLNQIPGIALEKSSITKRPTFPLSALLESSAMEQFLAVFDWYVEEVRQVLAQPKDAQA